jgi:hypothetical protein
MLLERYGDMRITQQALSNYRRKDIPDGRNVAELEKHLREQGKRNKIVVWLR